MCKLKVTIKIEKTYLIVNDMVYIFIAAWLAGSSSFGPLIRNGFLDIPTNTLALATVIWGHYNVTIMIHNIGMQNVLVFSAFSCGIRTR